jgi:catechol 2,3-dioxygenase
MATDPLDVDGLLAEGEAQATPWSGLPEGTRVGHVHLRVAHIAPAERFYCELIGFDLTTRYGDGASFVATGGYHHHVAFNTWAGVGALVPRQTPRG